jgi:APA family basic amino acid/polyamine antiporter
MGLAPAVIPILWSYGGWHQSTFMSGEFTDTRKALPLSLVTSIAVVTAVYLLINAAYLRALPVSELAQSKAIASDILGGLFGPAGMIIISAIVLISAGGALNSTIMTGGRIPFAVAQDHARCGWLAVVDPRFGTPLRSLVLNSLWAAGLVLWGNFEQLLFFFAFADWFIFAMVGGSVLILARRSGTAGALPGMRSPLVPVLFILSSLWVCWITVQEAPREALFGALLMLSGIPVYFLAAGRQKTAASFRKPKEESIEAVAQESIV